MQSLEQLTKRLKGLIIKRPGVALGLWGEAGIGKTHCATQLLQGSQCKNISLHATTALSKLARALPKPKTLPIWTTRILEKLELGEALSTEQTTSTFGAVLSGIAPFVLYFEDVHEASLERLEWLVAMAKVVTRLKGVALVVTSRTQPPEPFEAIRLEKLDFEAVKTLLEAEARSNLPLKALEWIHGKAAGNPLFTLEFFRFLTRQGFVWTDGQQWRWRKPTREIMPATVEALLEQTLRDVANMPELESLLGAKAVLGLNCSDELWAEVAGFETIDFLQLKTGLEENNLIINHEFSHPLYGEVIKQSLPVQTRQELSKVAIEKLRLNAPIKAMQYIDDAKLPADQEIELLHLAIDALKKQGKKIEAAQALAQTVKYLTGHESVVIALEAAQALFQADTEATIKLASYCANLEPENPEAIYIWANALAWRKQLELAEQTLERIPYRFQETLEWHKAKFRMFCYASEDNRAIEHWNAHPELKSDEDLESLQQITYSFIRAGDTKTARELTLSGLQREKVTSLDRAKLYSSLAALETLEGNFETSLQHFSSFIAIMRQEGNKYAVATALLNQSSALASLGRTNEHHESLEQSLQLYTDIGDGVSCAEVQSRFGALYLSLGKYDLAEENLLASCTVLMQSNPSGFLVEAQVGLAELYARTYSLIRISLKHAILALEVAKRIGGSSIWNYAVANELSITISGTFNLPEINPARNL